MRRPASGLGDVAAGLWVLVMCFFASAYAGAQGLEFKRAESFGSLIAKRDSGVGNDKHPRAAIRYLSMVRGHATHFALIIPS